MESGFFTDKQHQPTHTELLQALGDAAGLWTQLHADVMAEHGPLETHWRFSGKK